MKNLIKQNRDSIICYTEHQVEKLKRKELCVEWKALVSHIETYKTLVEVLIEELEAREFTELITKNHEEI